MLAVNLVLLFLVSRGHAQGPGTSCSSSSQCTSQLCCPSGSGGSIGYCSACCIDSDCPNGDICILQDNLQPSINFKTCFPKNILPAGSPCSKNEMCQSNQCNGGSTTFFSVTKGRCTGNVECYEEAVDFFGNDLYSINYISSARACQIKCQGDSQCNFFTYNIGSQTCYLKRAGGNRQQNFASISGPKYCLGDCTTYSYTKSDGKTYCGFYLKQGMTWSEAASRCEQLGARLPEIKTPADNQQIKALKPPTASNTSPLQGMWLGASDIAVEGTFRWRSDNSVIMTNAPWSATQPDNFGGNENCLQMVYDQGLWNDDPCNTGNVPQYTLCERLA